MATFESANIKKVNIGDTMFKIMTEEDEKKLKGYQFDSLVYRYIRAREKQAFYEYLNDKAKNKDFYERQANRDVMRFCQILNEVIGEHE